MLKHTDKFKGPFKNNITFDKQNIGQKILIPTFKHARRTANIYEALIQEFLEEGCYTSAKYFQRLMDKERKLYEGASIRERIFEERKLLLSVFDNCKMAEKAAILQKEYNGAAICSRLLLQCLLKIESYGKKFDWILMDAFEIIVKICEKVCEPAEVSKESLCRIYYKFGKYLAKIDLKESVKYLEKSFVLARGTNWLDEESANKGKSLHFSSAIARTYASTLLDYANKIFQVETQKAIEQGQKAIVILTGDIQHNRNLYIKAHLDMAEFQLEATNYDNSLSILNNTIKCIQPYAAENKVYLTFLARYHHLKGVGLERLKKHEVALEELHKALNIVLQLQLKHEEAMILLDIAKAYIDRGRSQYRMAEKCLRQSKEIFVKLNDVFNIKKSSYLMANLKMHNIQPMILELIKFSSNNYCNYYRLVRWKSMLLPFWRNLPYALEQEKHDPRRCILKTTEIPEKKLERKTFQRYAPKN